MNAVVGWDLVVFQRSFSWLYMVYLLLILASVLALASYSPQLVFKASCLIGLFSQLLILALASEASIQASPRNLNVGLGPSPGISFCIVFCIFPAFRINSWLADMPQTVLWIIPSMRHRISISVYRKWFPYRTRKLSDQLEATELQYRFCILKQLHTVFNWNKDLRSPAQSVLIDDDLLVSLSPASLKADRLHCTSWYGEYSHAVTLVTVFPTAVQLVCDVQ